MVVMPDRSELTRRRALEISLAQMGAMAESQLGDAISAFERRDMQLAAQVVKGDARLDAAHQRIERDAMILLGEGRLPPEGLREVVAAFKVANDLERVGDLAKNVAKRARVVSREASGLSIIGSIVRMGRESLRQFSDVLDAYASRDIGVAAAVWGADDDIDEFYNSLFNETLQSMMKDSAQVSVCTHLVFISKNFERVGDHATNIAEVLHFLVTGEALTSARPKGDETASTTVSIDD